MIGDISGKFTKLFTANQRYITVFDSWMSN